MSESAFFSCTLGLSSPWEIVSVSFSGSDKVDIHVDFSQAEFSCPVCGKPAKVTAVGRETWEHQDYFRYRASLHARVPVIDCTGGCGTKKIPLPWSRAGSLFALVSEETLVDSVVRFAE